MYRVLVLCAKNSFFNQVAEGYLRHFAMNEVEVYSASPDMKKSDPLAVRLMHEEGIDISHLPLHRLKDLRHLDFDFVLTSDEQSRLESQRMPSKVVKYHYDLTRIFIKSNVPEDVKYRTLRDFIRKNIRLFVKEHFRKMKTFEV